jgi:glycosyltransferase involved in cell wall biosynthesis
VAATEDSLSVAAIYTCFGMILSSEMTIWLDLTDLSHYFTRNSTVSGIQRTVASLAGEVIEAGNHATRLCLFSYERGEYQSVNAFALPPIDQPRSGLRKTLVSIVPKAIRPSRWNPPKPQLRVEINGPWNPSSGDWFLSAGASFSVPGLIQTQVASCVAFDLKLAVVIYDLIPWSKAGQFGYDPNSAQYASWTSGMEMLVRSADALFPISLHAKSEATRFAKERGFEIGPLNVVRLADEPFRLSSPSGDVAGDRVQESHFSLPYVLSVGSVEDRKNQDILVDAWEILTARHGPRVPRLILAGKIGAGGERILKRIDSSIARDTIVFRRTPSDRDLEALYAGALFTVFPSRAEGWGLPVAESLRAGKFCIASNVDSIPEIAGSMIDYFAPDDSSTCASLVEKYAFSEAARAEAKLRIMRYRLTTWRETLNAIETVLRKRSPLPRKRSAHGLC